MQSIPPPFCTPVTLVAGRDWSHYLFLQTTSLWIVLHMTPYWYMNFSGYKPGMEYTRTEYMYLHIWVSNIWMFFRMTAPVYTSLHACVQSHFSCLRLYILQNNISSSPRPLLYNFLFLLTFSFQPWRPQPQDGFEEEGGLCLLRLTPGQWALSTDITTQHTLGTILPPLNWKR